MRVTALDALRGLVIVIMALDHVRDFFHADAFRFQPDDLTKTTAVLFLTRWITHFCAPVFMFLAGAGAFLWRQKGRSDSELSAYLWKRGLLLVLLELTLLRLAMSFNLLSGPILLTVLWALGWCMVALGFLVRLPLRFVAPLSILVILLHNMTDSVRSAQFGTFAWMWKLLHEQGVIKLDGIMMIVAYPLIPWIAVMAAGYCFGQILVMDEKRRNQWLLRLGLWLTVGFFIVRWMNIYGDPRKWAWQESFGWTVLSFLRTTKYPASLDFLLMTLGPAILLLRWFYQRQVAKTNPLVIIGRVPLFYFLVHFFLIHLLTIPFALVYYGKASFLFYALPSAGGPANLYPPGYGYSLGVVYAVWVLVVVLMYPLCLWYGRYEMQRKRNSDQVKTALVR